MGRKKANYNEENDNEKIEEIKEIKKNDSKKMIAIEKKGLTVFRLEKDIEKYIDDGWKIKE